MKWPNLFFRINFASDVENEPVKETIKAGKPEESSYSCVDLHRRRQSLAICGYWALKCGLSELRCTLSIKYTMDFKDIQQQGKTFQYFFKNTICWHNTLVMLD